MSTVIIKVTNTIYAIPNPFFALASSG